MSTSKFIRRCKNNWFFKPFRNVIRVVEPDSIKQIRWLAVLQCVAYLSIAGVVALLLLTVALIPFTPSIADLKKAKAEQPSMLISVDGKQLAQYKQFNRESIAFSRMSPQTIQALIATEDHRFYQHHGIDFYRLGGAVVSTLGGTMQGGSTLTQQLARNLYPDEIGRSKSVIRKIKETITALKIERAFTKKEILETYLNTVPFLYNAFGIEMAARTYFDKSASKLTLNESATLVGMLKGTSYYNPVLNSERATRRRNIVLAQMVKHGVLNQNTFETLKRQPINLNFERQLEARGIAPHFAEYVRKWLVTWADKNDYNIYADGLKVYTTIDSRLQMLALQSVKRQANAMQAVADVEWARASPQLLSTSTASYLAMQRHVTPFSYFWATNPGLIKQFIRESAGYRNALAAGLEPAAAMARFEQDQSYQSQLAKTKSRFEAGFIAIDPRLGDIKAWVGSRDFDLDQYDHVARAQRQPGSTFKPFVYGAAVEKGMSPDKKYIDQVLTYRNTSGEVWQPRDANAASNRPMTAAEALSLSKNTITAQIMQETGVENVIDFAHRAGVRYSSLAKVPSLALGTSPVTLLEMATSYATIANTGLYQPPVMVTRVEDARGNVLAVFPNSSKREISRSTAQTLIDMMRGAVDYGTAKTLRTQFGITADIAAKTGTTQDNTDGWFIMMHPHLVTGAWVGFNDARVTIRSAYWGQGAHNALPMVADFFQQASAKKLIDIEQRFPRARDVLPGASIWGPAVDWLEHSFDQLLNQVSRPDPPSKSTGEQVKPIKRRPTDYPKSTAQPQAPDVSDEVQIRTETRSDVQQDVQPDVPPKSPTPQRVTPATDFEKAIENDRNGSN